MNHLLLLIENKSNCDLLIRKLSPYYQIMLPEGETPLEQPFDVCLVDSSMLQRFWSQIQIRKAAEQPLFLPCILVIARQDVDVLSHQLWQTIDDLLHYPLNERELQARIAIHLRTRHLSLEVKQQSENIQSFIYAMTHDLRAPLRAIRGFSQELWEEDQAHLSTKGKHYLETITQQSEQMNDLINALLNFCRVGYEGMSLQPVSLNQVFTSVLRTLQPDLERTQGQVLLQDEMPTVLAYPALLKMVGTNLLSNALKFVAPGTTPVVTVSTRNVHDLCRIMIQDNGIGISPEDQIRLFTPFVRLHGQEAYPGVGLGLATVRKAVELMEGRCGLISHPGEGSTFWLELAAKREILCACS